MAEALAPGSIRPDGNDDDRGAPWGVYQCAGDEDWCVICVRDDADWVALRKAMGDPPWAGDERFSSAAGRLPARRELDGLVGAWTADRSPDDVAAACQAHGVPAGPMRYASELLADPHLLERGFPASIVQPDAGPLTLDGPALRASDMAPARIGPAPRLGEHTREIC